MRPISLKTPTSAIQLPLSHPLDRDHNIILRPFILKDAPAVVESVSESLPDLKKFMPWAHFPQTLDSQRERLIGVIHKYWLGEDFGFGIFGATSGAHLGGIGLHPRTLNSRGFEIGYWIRSSFAGKGLATAATRALIVYGFHYLDLTRIQCGHNSNNLASARVNDHCGFKIEGSFKNFETVPTQEQLNNGYSGSDICVVRGLCPQDIPSLSWYADTLKNIAVFDWLGKKVDT